jgi:hypothetical protein
MNVNELLRDAWMLYKKNIRLILLFCVLVSAVTSLQLWIMLDGTDYINWIVDTLIFPDNEQSMTELFSGSMAIVYVEIAGIAETFVYFCGMVMLTANSMFMLNYRVEMLANIKRILRIWLLFAIITTLFNAIAIFQTYGIFAVFRHSFANTSDVGMFLLGLIVSAVFTVIIYAIKDLAVLLLLLIQQYAVCHIVGGDAGSVIRKSLRMIRQTVVKLVLFILLYIGYTQTVGALTYFGHNFFLESNIIFFIFLGNFISHIFFTAGKYFIVMCLSVLYVHMSKPVLNQPCRCQPEKYYPADP